MLTSKKKILSLLVVLPINIAIIMPHKIVIRRDLRLELDLVVVAHVFGEEHEGDGGGEEQSPVQQERHPPAADERRVRVRHGAVCKRDSKRNEENNARFKAQKFNV